MLTPPDSRSNDKSNIAERPLMISESKHPLIYKLCLFISPINCNSSLPWGSQSYWGILDVRRETLKQSTILWKYSVQLVATGDDFKLITSSNGGREASWRLVPWCELWMTRGSRSVYQSTLFHIRKARAAEIKQLRSKVIRIHFLDTPWK